MTHTTGPPAQASGKMQGKTTDFGGDRLVNKHRAGSLGFLNSL